MPTQPRRPARKVGSEMIAKAHHTGIDEDFVRRSAHSIRNADVLKAMENGGKIRRKVAKGGPLRRFLGDVRLMCSILRDYWRREYRAVPWWAIAAITFALLYVMNPFDIVPDMIPFVGLLDDAAVVAACLALVGEQLESYQHWTRRKKC